MALRMTVQVLFPIDMYEMSSRQREYDNPRRIPSNLVHQHGSRRFAVIVKRETRAKRTDRISDLRICVLHQTTITGGHS